MKIESTYILEMLLAGKQQKRFCELIYLHVPLNYCMPRSRVTFGIEAVRISGVASKSLGPDTKSSKVVTIWGVTEHAEI